MFRPMADATPGEMVPGNLLEDWEMRQLAEREQQEMALLERELLRPELPLNTVSLCCSLTGPTVLVGIVLDAFA